MQNQGARSTQAKALRIGAPMSEPLVFEALTNSDATGGVRISGAICRTTASLLSPSASAGGQGLLIIEIADAACGKPHVRRELLDEGRHVQSRFRKNALRASLHFEAFIVSAGAR